MLKPETLSFLADLKNNNNKPWFDATRPAYEAARADFLHLVTVVLAGLERLDPAIAESNLQPKSCMFRINRDVRFSKDKSPYKTNFGAWFNAGGKQSPSAGYYLNIEPGGSFVAGGMYMPDAKVLTTLRQEIDYNLADFEALLAQPTFKAYYDGLDQDGALQRPPKGYDADNPAISYLKLKSFTAAHNLPDSALTKPDFPQKVLGAFEGLQPLVHFFNRALT